MEQITEQSALTETTESPETTAEPIITDDPNNSGNSHSEAMPVDTEFTPAESSVKPTQPLHPMQPGEALPLDLREAAKLLYMQGFKPAAIAQQTGVNRRTVVTWIGRYNWQYLAAECSAIVRRAKPQSIEIRNPSTEQSDASRSLRAEMASILAKQTKSLGEIKPRKSIQAMAAVAEVLESFARTAKIVHDWGQGGALGLILGPDLSIEANKREVLGGVLPNLVKPQIEHKCPSSCPAIESNSPVKDTNGGLTVDKTQDCPATDLPTGLPNPS